MKKKFQTFLCVGQIPFFMFFGLLQWEHVIAGEQIEEIVVEGKYLSIDKVNAVKTPTPILNIPQSVTILTETTIEKQAFGNFGDIMRYTPGLAISQGEGHRDAIIIRGIQTTADFFVDGIRDDVQYFRPLYNVSQVEILRGPNALLFGRGGGGGVVNRVQKKAELGKDFLELDVGINTFRSYSAAIDANSEVSQKAAFRLNAYYQGLDNHRDFFNGESYAINPTITYQHNDKTTASLSWEYVDDGRVVDRGVPSMVDASATRKPLEGYSNTFFGSPNQNLTTLEANLIRARLDHTFSDHLRGNVTLHYANYDKLYQNLYASESVVLEADGISEVELDGYRDKTDRENLILQANLIGEIQTGLVVHTILSGFELGNQRTSNARENNVFAQNNDDQLVIPFSDPLSIPSFSFSSPARDRESEVDFASIYFQSQTRLTEEFLLLFGLRYDTFEINVLDIIEKNDGDTNDGNFDRKDSELTSRFGFIYKPVENFSLYASYSETFLPRSGDQFLTLNLDSESTRPQFFESDEVGIKWDLSSNLNLTFAAFDLDRETYTSIDPEDPEQLIIIEGSEIRGWELQFGGALTERYRFTAGYASLDGEVKRANGGGNDGNATRQTPENMFSIWNSFQVNNKLSLSLGVIFQDSFFVREDNSVKVPDFTRVDAAVYYEFNDRMKLQLNIENLLDEKYFPDAHSNNNITTGEPFNARLSLKYDF
ncbi:MAG: TonB-dependent receptor [Candidatus Azotimanducaceae bacterium]